MGGGELFHQIVKLTYFSEELSRHVIMQVASGIQYLHQVQGVVHRYVMLAPLYLIVTLIPSLVLVQRHQARKYPLRSHSYHPFQAPENSTIRRRERRRRRILTWNRWRRNRSYQDCRLWIVENRLERRYDDSMWNRRIHGSRNRQG